MDFEDQRNEITWIPCTINLSGAHRWIQLNGGYTRICNAWTEFHMKGHLAFETLLTASRTTTLSRNDATWPSESPPNISCLDGTMRYMHLGNGFCWRSNQCALVLPVISCCAWRLHVFAYIGHCLEAKSETEDRPCYSHVPPASARTNHVPLTTA